MTFIYGFPFATSFARRIAATLWAEDFLLRWRRFAFLLCECVWVHGCNGFGKFVVYLRHRWPFARLALDDALAIGYLRCSLKAKRSWMRPCLWAASFFCNRADGRIVFVRKITKQRSNRTARKREAPNAAWFGLTPNALQQRVLNFAANIRNIWVKVNIVGSFCVSLRYGTVCCSVSVRIDALAVSRSFCFYGFWGHGCNEFGKFVVSLRCGDAACGRKMSENFRPCPYCCVSFSL